ncbi:MAG: hypothetical protein ACQETQ_03340 [Spirochaetota bacterium]
MGAKTMSKRGAKHAQTPASSVPNAAEWFRLDNAAKIFPASSSEVSPEVFRVMVTLDEPVRIEALQRAVSRLAKRTPYYQVHLRRGLFWYYLERHNQDPHLHLLPDTPVSPIAIKRPQEPLYRVQVGDRRVAVDVSHILTDGYGAMRFLISVIAEYVRQIGQSVSSSPYLLDPDAEPSSGEFEDAYKRYYKHDQPNPPALSPAYHLPGIRAWRRYRTISGYMSVSAVRRVSKEKGVSITEYLCALYLEALAAVHAKQSHTRIKPRRSVMRLEIPVNVRRFYSTETMRNFSLFVSPEIDLRLGGYSFDEILRAVHHAMRTQLEEKQLARQIARNVGGELNPVTRVVPLFLKDIYLSYLHDRFGDNLYSGVISNLGPVDIPQDLRDRVSAVGFVLGPNPIIKKNLAVVSLGDELTLTFGSVIERRDLERTMFRTLVSHGVPVTVTERGT